MRESVSAVPSGRFRPRVPRLSVPGGAALQGEACCPGILPVFVWAWIRAAGNMFNWVEGQWDMHPAVSKAYLQLSTPSYLEYVQIQIMTRVPRLAENATLPFSGANVRCAQDRKHSHTRLGFVVTI